MSLSNVATFVVLPPVNLVGVALAGAVLSLRFRRLGPVVAICGALGLAVLAMPVTAGWLTVGLEDGLAPAPVDLPEPPGAIVVLGGDVSRLASGGSDVGPLSLERGRAAALLARRTGLPILVTGSVAGEDTADVCVVMADSLRDDFGLTARWQECRSLDTWENAALSAPLLRRDGIGSVYVVTHAWHMRRALLAFRPTGLRVTPAPTSLGSPPRWSLEGLVPTARALLQSYWAVHEWAGIAYYELRLLRQ